MSKPPLAVTNPDGFTFIDLFAGIGGFRHALDTLGGRCVFTSEWDKHAQRTYEVNFGDKPQGDITRIKTAGIPDHEILCAGFPCQAFSIAGKRKGFEEVRGTLFFDVVRIMAAKRPRAAFLENVKGLANHDKGRTLKTILRVLREELGYHVPEPRVVNAKDHGVPQNRERIYIACFREKADAARFSPPAATPLTLRVKDIMERNPVGARYYISDTYLRCLREHRARHEAKGHGFGYEILNPEGVSNAVVVGGMGRERNLVLDPRLRNFTPETRIRGAVNREGIRKMTPREWARLQGFPDEFTIICTDAQAYKQFGNSVAIPAVRAFAASILSACGIPAQN